MKLSTTILEVAAALVLLGAGLTGSEPTPPPVSPEPRLDVEFIELPKDEEGFLMLSLFLLDLALEPETCGIEEVENPPSILRQ